MSKNLNNIYKRFIETIILPKYDFISGIESLNVEKDEIDRVSLKINFYLKSSWADTMFVNHCQKKFLSNVGYMDTLHMADMDDCVFNGFYDEKQSLIKDLSAINKFLGYSINYYKVSFDIRFIIDFEN